MKYKAVALALASALYGHLYAVDTNPESYYADPNLSTDVPATKTYRYVQDVINLSTFGPGDTIYLRTGNHQAKYADAPIAEFKEANSGTATSYITMKAYPGEAPVIKTISWEAIKVSGASYIRLEKLVIQGPRASITQTEAEEQPFPGGAGTTNCYNRPVAPAASGKYNGKGILIVGPNLKWSPAYVTQVPHHIDIVGCEVFDCTSSGIAAQQADYITVSKCRVYNNCWYTLYGTSGINFYQMVNTDGTTGIHNVIEKNLVYDNKLKINPISTSCNRYDGNGIILDDFRHEQTYNKKTPSLFSNYTAYSILKNNIITGSSGSGISLFKSNNIKVYYNTCALNGTYLAANLNPAEFACGDFNNIDVQRNIFYSGITTTSNHHVYYLYRVNGAPNGSISYVDNLHNGFSNSQVALPAGSVFLDQVDPAFNNMNTQAKYPFRPTQYIAQPNNLITDVTDDYLGYPRFVSPIVYDNGTGVATPTKRHGSTLGAYESTSYCGDQYVILRQSLAIWRNQYPSDFPIINTGEELIVRAGGGILIEPSEPTHPSDPGYFEAKYGSLFVAEIGACSSPTSNNSRKTNSEEANTGTEEQSLLTVYPNPVSSALLSFSRSVSSYKLINAAGKEILSGASADQLNTGGLAKGLYLLHLEDQTIKVVVE